MVDRGWRALAVFCLVTVGLFGTGLVSAFRIARNVNEPDPARFSIAKAERMLRSGGVEARIDRVLHVDLDANALIVVGHVRRLDPARLTPLVSGEAQYRPGAGRYGGVTVASLGRGRELVAVGSATTRGEARQSASRFRALMEEFVRRERAP